VVDGVLLPNSPLEGLVPAVDGVLLPDSPVEGPVLWAGRLA